MLTYDLVRTVLRDSRFAMPQGIGLAVQGITSGPVWDKVCQMLMSAGRPTPPAAPPGVKGVHPAGRRADARRMRRRHHRAG